MTDNTAEEPIIENDEIVEEESTEEPEETLAPEETEEESEDDIVIIDGEDSPSDDEEVEAAKAPEWVKRLRVDNREKSKELRQLREKIKALEQASSPEQKHVLGKKPALEDFDYDADKFETELEKWYETKKKVDEESARIEAEKQNQQKEWQDRLSFYEESKSTLKVKDYEDAEEFAQSTFNQTQLGIVVQGAENPALVVYALGKHAKKAAELSAIKDPVKFAFAIAKLEANLKVTSKRNPPPPERKVAIESGPTSASVDSTLEKLRADAERTGDMTKVIAYKRKLKSKGK